MKTAFAILVFAAACGGKSQPATSTTPAPATADHADMKSEHHEMSPEMTKFHDVLAPRWHADKGDKRMKDTCAAIPEFQTDADALAKATPPSGADAAKWSAGTKELTDAVTALGTTCKSNDLATFEPAFHRVHESFHGLMAIGGGMDMKDMKHDEMKHDMKGEGEHHKM